MASMIQRTSLSERGDEANSGNQQAAHPPESGGHDNQARPSGLLQAAGTSADL
jgi:hypothetical protein